LLKIVPLVACLILTTACATKPPSASILNSFNSPERLDSLQVAAQSSPLRVAPSAELSTSLDASSRVVAYDTFRSFYRTVEVDAQNNGRVAFTVKSICSCLGFDKRVAVPIVLAFDATGRSLNLSDIHYEVQKPSGITPLRVVLSGQVQTLGSTKFRLLLLADNSQVDSPVQKIRLLNQYGSPVMNLEILSYPTGEMTLAVALEKR
jgi:hypothetical protein